MIKLLDILKEIKINNPNIPRFEEIVNKIDKLWQKDISLYKVLLKKFNYNGPIISFKSYPHFWEKELSNDQKIKFNKELDNYLKRANGNL